MLPVTRQACLNVSEYVLKQNMYSLLEQHIFFALSTCCAMPLAKRTQYTAQKYTNKCGHHLQAVSQEGWR